MSFFRNLSIHRKLALIVIVTCGVALCLATAVMLVYDRVTAHRNLVNNLRLQAEIVGNNTTAALTYEYKEDAREVLASFKAVPSIVSAQLFDAQNQLFATYERQGTNLNQPAQPSPSNHPNWLLLTNQIRLNHNVIGELHVVSTLEELQTRWHRLLLLMGVMLALSTTAAFGLFLRLHHVITDPITELAQTAQHVATEKNYTMRARKLSDDELGHLTDCFNEMLTQIQLQNRELQQIQEGLEQRVATRTQELSQANTLLKREMDQRSRLESQLRQAQKMEAIGQLAGGVAHDFNNILTVILGHVTLLDSHPQVPADALDSLKEIESSAKRAANLTQQLLAFSRRQVIKIVPLNLNQALINLTKMLQRLIGEHIALSCHFASDLPAIEADVHMVEQVVINLAVNARDAMPKGGTLTLVTSAVVLEPNDVSHNAERRAGQFVCLQVQDTGCGMDEATLQRIFEPFFTTKPVGKGTGLGLATVYGILKQHNGWIEVASTPQQGTTFSVYLPASAQPTRETPAPQRTPATSSHGNETILVVEDETPVRQFTSRYLQRCGYRVFEAASGVRALDVWDQHRDEIDLVLTDLVMPEGINGRELVETMRRERPRLRVLYSSGYSEEFIKGNLQLDAERDFLPKPYSPVRLAQMIRERLDGS